MDKKPNTLLYNVAWMDRVFKSRAAVEALLSPERDAGNITPRDYDTSLGFLPGYHRHYPVLACIGATAVMLIRRPKWSNRTALVAFTCGFTGYTLGELSMLRAHYEYVRSLENPAGFGRAMQNVHASIGGAVPRGFIIEHNYKADDPSENPEYEPSIVLPSSSDSVHLQPSHPSKQAPLSKWDQIRKLNNNTASNSSWETLRQKHERETIISRKTSNSHSEDQDFAPTEH